MLTQEEYQQIAQKINLPSQAHVGGEYVPSKSKKTFESFNPATNEKLRDIDACNQDDLNRAVQVAKDTFESGQWSKLHPSSRKEILIKFATLIEQHQDELSVLECLESGKPISDCVQVDIPETAKCISWFAQAIDKVYDTLSPSGEQTMGMIVKEPIGVVACVLPWNYPLMMLAWKLGPALAAGNSIIVKPAELTSMSALRLSELATQAGIPKGVLNVLPGLGEEIGRAIGLHPDIDVVSFTGSTQVGRKFLEYSAQSNLKEITLECGGKSPSIVLSDAKHLDNIAENVAFAAFVNSGQNCCANSRLIVHKDLKKSLLDKIIEKTKEWSLGNPLDPKNKLGTMISAEHFDKVMGYIEQGKREGAKCIVGGEALEHQKGLYIKPTIFDGVTHDMVIASEEMFGPILCVIEVSSDEEAIKLANDTAYGLQASLYSGSLANALVNAKTIRAGTVSINCYAEGDLSTPFGGLKISGFGGKDNSLKAFDQYMETKTIWVNLEES